MRIIGARWSKPVNFVRIECTCKIEMKPTDKKVWSFEWPVDQWTVRCPRCGYKESIETLRNNIKPGDIRPGQSDLSVIEVLHGRTDA